MLFIIYICSELNIPLLLLPAPQSLHNGKQLRSRYNLQRGERTYLEVQTLHHGGQLRARATRARFDPSIEDQGRAEQRRPKKQMDSSFATEADNILGFSARLDTSDSEAEADTEDKY